MTIYYFQYVEPLSVLKLADRAGYAVWYYLAGNAAGTLWTDPAKMPEGVLSAVLRANHDVTLGDPIYQTDFGGKDPVPDPPPPPPPYRGDLGKYLKSSELSKYFAGGRSDELRSLASAGSGTSTSSS